MEVFGRRRQRVLDAIDGVALVPAAPVMLRNNDVEHEYRQDSDLYYLTGFEEPASLLLLTTVHPEHKSVLFVRPRDRDREVWDGERAGVEGARERVGVDVAYSIEQLDERLHEYLAGAKNLHFDLGKQPALDRSVIDAIGRARGRGRSPRPWPTTIHHPEPLWHEMRVRKDAHELGLMRKAVAITAEAHCEAMARTCPGQYEYEVEAIFRGIFRRHGCGRSAYAPIVGSGPNATVLHYHANDRRFEDGELLLIDAGCEYGYYAADVTRTYPVNGRFDDAQRRLYEVVLEAQLAAIEAVVPGSTVERVHEVCLRQLIEGMRRLRMLEGDVDELIKSEKYRRYYMHRTSHWLGMDVHDVGAYFVDGQARLLEPGMVLTIEPGLYVASDDDQAPAELRGTGIRIEDDVLITEAGCEVLTALIPKTVDEVEAACRG